MPASVPPEKVSLRRSASIIRKLSDSKDPRLPCLPLEINQRLNVFRHFKSTNDFMVSQFSSERRAQLFQMFRIRKNATFALGVQEGDCRVSGNLTGLFQFLFRAFPKLRKCHGCAEQGCKFSPGLFHNFSNNSAHY